MISETKENIIRKLKEIDIVREEKVKLKHAGASGFYVDVKKAYGYPEILDLICRQIGKRVSKKTTCVAAAGYGGLPLAAIISRKRKLKLTLVREKPKNHGRNVWIDGYEPQAGDKIWIVDDVLTTGKSVKKIIKTLKSTGAKISGCAVVVKRGKGKIGITCHHLLILEELLKP